MSAIARRSLPGRGLLRIVTSAPPTSPSARQTGLRRTRWFSGASEFVSKPANNGSVAGVAADDGAGSCFAEMFRRDGTSYPIRSGDILRGHVVGSARGSSKKSRFTVVDFGLKSEVQFAPDEISSSQVHVGDAVSMPLVQLEDNFNEPSLDFSGRSLMPSLMAERYRLLVAMSRPDAANPVRMVQGRILSANRGGFTVKVFGVEGFLPKTHSIGVPHPVVGEHCIFTVLQMKTVVDRNNQRVPKVTFHPVVSNYVSMVLILANILGYPDAWKASGGGSDKDRLAYLEHLSKVVFGKNPLARMQFHSRLGNQGSFRGGQQWRSKFKNTVDDLLRSSGTQAQGTSSQGKIRGIVGRTTPRR